MKVAEFIKHELDVDRLRVSNEVRHFVSRG